MEVAFIVQNLTHKSDSVGFDCVIEHNIVRDYLSEGGSVRLFADLFDKNVHPDLPIEPFSEFYDYYIRNPDAVVVYHFCDGWGDVDDFLIKNIPNLVVRWHNNTTPWFYALNWQDFAAGCLNGFKVISKFVKATNVRFWVNSEFSRRQLEVLGGKNSQIDTVFPASPLLQKGAAQTPQRMSSPAAAFGPIEILFVGRVVPHKGHRHVLSVAATVQKFTGRDVRVTFVGALELRLKPYWTELQDIAGRLEVNTIFTGIVSDDQLEKIYDKCHVFICLSEHEGFGMPVFEAMRREIPVVAWACSALADLLGDHPLSSPRFDINYFAACVVAALNIELRPDIVQSQRKILQGYTFDVVSNQLIGAISVYDAQRAVGIYAHPLIDLAILDNSRRVYISNMISNIAEDIEIFVDPPVETFVHDASINYMSAYDIIVYHRLLELIITSSNGYVKSSSRIGNLDDLHPRFEIIRRVMRGESPLEIEGLDREDILLTFDDEVFVKLAYVAMLGRNPEQYELRNSINLLRHGIGKHRLLHKLNLTSGGADVSPRMGEALLSLFKLSDDIENLADIDQSNEERIRKLEITIGRLSRYLLPNDENVNSSDFMHYVNDANDLLALDDKLFVEIAFRIILGRAGDPAGIDHYVGALRNGLDRVDVLIELSNSSEGRSHQGYLNGLAELLAGRTGEFGAAVHEGGRIDGVSRGISRLENQVGRLIAQIIAQAERNDGRAPATLTAAESLLRLMPGPSEVALTAHAVDLDQFPSSLNLADRVKDLLIEGRFVDPDDLYVDIDRVHQILITGSGGVPDSMPDVVQNNIDSIRHHHPNAYYRLWGEADLRVFIAEHFSREVLSAFDRLQAFALKADLARYCVLYIQGGLYSDLSNRFLNPLQIERGKLLACFREHKPLHGALWMNQNTIIYAAPRQPEIKLAIDLVVSNVNRRDYGVNSLAPSGPVLFGRVFAAIARSDHYQIGEAINLQVDGGLNRACYVSSDGTLVAARLQGGGGKPSELGLKGTNIYGQMWDERAIYGEGRLIFSHDDPAIGTVAPRSPDGIFIRHGAAGTQIYGPYAALSPGPYTAIVRFAKATSEGILALDACVQSGTNIIKAVSDVSLDSDGCAELAFTLPQHFDDVEIRVQTDGRFVGQFRDLTIVRNTRLHEERSIDAGPQAAPRGRTSSLTEVPEADVQAKAGIEIAYIHQIVNLDDGLYPGALSSVIEENIRLIGRLHDKAEHLVWTPSRLRAFISRRFSAEVIEAYDNLLPFAYQSEFGRYCLLYAKGGLYADLGVRFVNPLMVPHHCTIAGFRKSRPDDGSSWSVDTGLLYAAPGEPELRAVLESVMANVRNGLYGALPSSPTGADLLGRTLAVHYRAERYFGGEIVALTNGLPKQNECFLDFHGRLVAVRMPAEETDPEQAAKTAAELAWRERRAYGLNVGRA